MSTNEWKSAGVFAYQDTGVPSSGDGWYPTLVMVHGLAWMPGVFSRLSQQADRLRARVVLVNRRGYPRSKPFDESDRAVLVEASQDEASGPRIIEEFARARTQELYDFLVELVAAGGIAPKSIIISGWSLGALWTTAILALAPSFPPTSINLHEYVRRVVAYDPSPQVLGYPVPEAYYDPIRDPSFTPEEAAKEFTSWVTGYFAHGDTPETLSQRLALLNPRPSIRNMSPEEIEKNTYPPAVQPDSVEILFVMGGIQHGTFSRLRSTALFPSQDAATDAWSGIEFRYFWCDHSTWQMPWAFRAFTVEVSEARKSGKSIRKHSVQRMRGANHFAHWDEPERTLKLLLSDEPIDD